MSGPISENMNIPHEPRPEITVIPSDAKEEVEKKDTDNKDTEKKDTDTKISDALLMGLPLIGGVASAGGQTLTIVGTVAAVATGGALAATALTISFIFIAATGHLILAVHFNTLQDQNIRNFVQYFKTTKGDFEEFSKKSSSLPKIHGYEATEELKEIYRHINTSDKLESFLKNAKDASRKGDKVLLTDWEEMMKKLSLAEQREICRIVSHKLNGIISNRHYPTEAEKAHDNRWQQDFAGEIDTADSKELANESYKILFGTHSPEQLENLSKDEFQTALQALIDREHNLAKEAFGNLHKELEDKEYEEYRNGLFKELGPL